MSVLRYSLLSDGSSDRALLHVLRYLLLANGVVLPIHSQWVDFRQFPKPPGRLPDRIRLALDWFPCDLLFVHRDAESASLAERRREIEMAVATVSVDASTAPPAICVVPVRMTEAWFLFSESALREAAGNPNGRLPLALPFLEQVESIPDPKRLLHEALREASGLQRRRRRAFSVDAALHRLAEIVDDYGPLRALPAFRSLEADLQDLIIRNAWNELA